MKPILELFILIIAVVLIVLFYSFHWADPDNFINQELRYSFTRSTFAKRLFNLNQIGDNLSSYIDPGIDQITVEIDRQSNITLPDQLDTWIEDMVKATINKNANIITDSDHLLPPQSSYTDDQLFALTRPETHYQDSNPYLHIIYVSQSAQVPTNAGRVVNQDTIFMFADILDQLSTRSEITRRLEQSTLMHEWGHLLGLEHIDQENCIMSQSVEVFGNYRYQGSNIPTTYCPDTLYQLHHL